MIRYDFVDIEYGHKRTINLDHLIELVQYKEPYEKTLYIKSDHEDKKCTIMVYGCLIIDAHTDGDPDNLSYLLSEEQVKQISNYF